MLSNKQNGNVLFLILITVVLFAALSYAATQSTRSGGSTIDKEQAELDQAVTENCEAAINVGRMRLTTMNDCSPEEISFELPNGVNENEDNPDDTSCFMFHPDGAGVLPCGSYTEAIIPLGTIDLLDTETVAQVGTGIYMKCASWEDFYPGNEDQVCVIQLSPDGINFVDGTDVCLMKSGDGRTGSFPGIFYSRICNAACGGSANGYDPNTPASPIYYVEDDDTLSPYSGACSLYGGATRVKCSCWPY